MRKIYPVILGMIAFSSYALEKQEAIDFLFSTLSLPEKSDYSEQFYLDNIDLAFKAREEMPWGKIVPDREFLHFVLPVRANNENPDEARGVFYEELKERVKDLSMEDAILEVNHWCHEKVTYQPSDSRTSSPLSAVSQAIGRCGEESTFTVAALRSVGIPARQIYTPRWAHTDDNHAWVEAWANGKWYFLGACEPEPILNLAWFNEPVSRGVLMTTNVVGDYEGDEEILLKQPLTTRINVTENYAPVYQLPVKVIYPDGNPAKNVKVDFGVYNYAEFYPVASKNTDSNGFTSLTAGKGDMLVWASDGDRFGFAKGKPGTFTDDSLIVVLDKNREFEGEFDIDIIPPSKTGSPLMVNENLVFLNELRKSREDSIRNAYVATFFSPEDAWLLAEEMGVDPEKLSKILVESRGNHKKLTELLRSVNPSKRKMIINLLGAIKEKDRRDISVEAIVDHIDNTVEVISLDQLPEGESFYIDYILNPRIENELIRGWRSTLKNGFGEDTLKLFRNDPKLIVEWIAKNINIVADSNPQNLRMSPGAVWQQKTSDLIGRKIFYVATARTAFIPSRLDPVTGNPQYYTNGDWIDVVFDDSDNKIKDEMLPKGWVRLTFNPEDYITDPKYFSQFTISKISDGNLQLLEYDENATFSRDFANPQRLEAGQYMLTSGRRMADGSVLSKVKIFHIEEGDTVTIPLNIRNDETKISVIGSLNAENLYQSADNSREQSLLSTAGRGYYILGLLQPNHEPSEHALNDISAVREALEKDGRKIFLLFEDENKIKRFDASRFPDLPTNAVIGIDKDRLSTKEITESLHLESPDFPIFVIADSFNRIVWISSGYNIGLGEQILSILSQVE